MTLDLTCTDLFCGAGGSTTGATQAGANVKLAINHWKRAVETHNTNYPETVHVLTDLHKANPRRFPRTTMLMASPECTSHTLAKGRKRTEQAQLELWAGEPDEDSEAEERSRCTMWTPLDWAEYHDYQVVILENVVDVHLWRPFQSWLQAWKSLDYEYELVYLNSMYAHPTPQSRDRMYFVAWKRKNRRPDLKITPLAYCAKCEQKRGAIQSWKNPTKRYGKYRQQYVYRCPVCASEVTPWYYAAANAIDWSLPAQRIGDRKRPLREKTMQRIAYGLEKFAGAPFSIPMTRTQDRLREVMYEAFPTQTATETQALVLNLSHTESGHASYIVPAQHMPLPTQTTRQDQALAIPPFIMDHLGEYRPRAITAPFSTICAAGNHQSLVTPPAWLMTYYNNGQLVPIEGPVPTVTTLERCALVTGCEAVKVEDCGFRMLSPREIQSAMAFPSDYVVTGTHRERVKQLGNAVTPPVIKLLMQRCLASLS